MKKLNRFRDRGECSSSRNMLEQLEPRLMLSTTTEGILPAALPITGIINNVEIEETVTFNDPILQMAVQNAVNTQVGQGYPLTEANLAQLTTLDASRLITTTDLTGLEYCINLVSLDLSFCGALSNISQLATMTKLETLSLSNTSVSNLLPLAGMTQMRDLNISKDFITGLPKISNISSLSGMTNLETLNAEVNNISDLSPLSGLTSLESLNLNYNSMSDITSLAGLTSLQSLKLSNDVDEDGKSQGSIRNITPLAGLTNLTELLLPGNKISNISSLAGLGKLTTLNLKYNNISDISSLAGITTLTSLILGNNSITDISALSGLTNLKELHLLTNSITDVSPLAGLTEIQMLYMSGNNISSIAALAGMTKLTHLNLANNNISNISVLQNMTLLENLNLSYNILTSLQPLVDNPGLTGSGDLITISYSLTSIDMYAQVQQLENRGIDVKWDPYGVVIPQGQSCTFADINGDAVTVQLKGNGKVYLLFTQALYTSGLNGGISLSDIQVVNSDADGKLYVTVKKGRNAESDGKTTSVNVTVEGSLKEIVAKDLQVTFGGTVGGYVGKVRLDSLSGAFNIAGSYDPTVGEYTDLQITQVQDAAIDVNGLGINKFNIGGWFDTDETRDTLGAAWIGSVMVKGGKDSTGAAIAPDFSANVTLTGADPKKGYALNKFSAKGDVDMAIDAADNMLGTFSVGSWIAEAVTASFINKVSAKTDIFADMTLSGTLIKNSIMLINSLKASGTLSGIIGEGGSGDSGASIGTISARDILGWVGFISGNIKSISASNTIAGSAVVASTLQKISSKYELGATFMLVGTDAKGYSLGTLSAGGTFGGLIEAEGGVKSIKAGDGECDVTASFVDSINIKGGKNSDGSAVTGDFLGNVTLTDIDPKGIALGKFNVKGIMDGEITAAITSRTAPDSSQVDFRGGIKSITVGQWESGSLTAGPVVSITTKANKRVAGVDGDLSIDMTVDTTGYDMAGNYAVKTIKVAGDATAPESETLDWNIGGSVSTLSAAGTVTGLNMDVTGDLKSATFGKIVDSDIDVTGIFGNLSIKGLKIPRGEEIPAFAINTDIHAAGVTKASVMNWEISDPLRFDLPDKDAIGKLSYKDTRPVTKQSWSWKNEQDWPALGDLPTENTIFPII